MELGEYIKRQRKARGWTLEDVALRVNSDTGNLSRMERGKQMVTEDMLTRLAAIYGCPDLASFLAKMQVMQKEDRAKKSINSIVYEGSARVIPDELKEIALVPEYTPSSSLTPILAWEYAHELPEGDFVFVPRLDIQLAAGAGKEQPEFVTTKAQPQAFRADWIRQERLKPNMLACMYASGDSMEPIIFDGDSLVIDLSQAEAKDNAVFAIWYDGGERVKRLFRRPGGGLVIRSDNSNAYPDLVLTANEAEHVRIIGRVVHKAGKGGL